MQPIRISAFECRGPDAPGPNDVFIDAEQEESDGALRHLRGHVVIETSDRKLQADEVDFDDDTGEAEARGNVRFESYLEGDKLECDHGKYNVNDQTGIFWDVRGTSPAKIVARPGLLTTTNPFYFEGKWAERKADRYILHDGFVTDCKIPKPWWRLTAPKFDIIPHDRAIGYHAVFHVKALPLLYFPAFYKSLKRLPRKSGFLTPSIGRSSRFGEFFGLGYYWAINRSLRFPVSGRVLQLARPGQHRRLSRKGEARHRFRIQPVRRERSRPRHRQRRDPEAGRLPVYVRRPVRISARGGRRRRSSII